MAAVESVAKGILVAAISQREIIFLQIMGLLVAKGHILSMCY
jgi:hypothetical protein